jgi:hypothetical protein
MNRLSRRAFGVCAVLALLLGWSAVRSDEPVDSLKEQVLILQNSQLLKGIVSRSPNGYVVEHPGGRLVIPFEEVRVVGKDLRDAYRRLTESFPKPTAATHYELALWCQSHQLKDESRTQLVMALDRDPDHEAARDMLKRIDEQAAAARKRAAAGKPPRTAPRIVGGIELPEIESLAGLSRETAAQFTGRIQPLMINKCGNASCHGPKSESGFRLESSRGTGPGSRVHTERNLAQMLKQIDQANPQISPLLTVPARSHGGMSKAIFYGRSGEIQLKSLKNWVRSASTELARDSQAAKKRPSVVAVQPKFPPSPMPQMSVDEETELSDAVPMASVGKPPVEAVKKDEVELEDDEDAFDPEVFNRRYHGTPATPQPRKPTP